MSSIKLSQLTSSVANCIQVFSTAHAFFKYDMDDPMPKRRTLVYFKDPSALIHGEEALIRGEEALIRGEEALIHGEEAR